MRGVAVDGVRISQGMATGDVPAAVAILIEAFAEKIAHELRPRSEEQLVRLVTSGISREHALVAAARDGSLIGVAGVAAPGRPFFHIPFAVLRREFGLPGALTRWAYSLLEVAAAPRRPGTRRVEVLAVAAGSRGRGVGSALLDAAADGARQEGAKRLILEVVDTNGRAKELYERAGFRATRTVRSGALTAGAGYRAIHFMRRDL
ncbi:MAG: GNAT family N-acetyltransferase [Coriobacteriia bacterium]|nr:GNAT family N-acetyltransferase [Coriobacteriia bacterium]